MVMMMVVKRREGEGNEEGFVEVVMMLVRRGWGREDK